MKKRVYGRDIDGPLSGIVFNFSSRKPIKVNTLLVL